MKKTFLLLFALAAFCAGASAQKKYVGGDISLLPTYEEHGVRYLGHGGNDAQVKPLDYFGDSAHWNAMRVRLFVDPSKASTSDKGEGVRQDLSYATALAKRITAKGYSLMLDFHYSDTWTDPGKHSTPSAWTSSDANVLADSVYAYTQKCLQKLVTEDAKPEFIQVGNEVNYGMLWPTGYCYPGGGDGNNSKIGKGTWNNFAAYLKAGVRACREVCPEAKVVLHVALHNAPNDVVAFYNTVQKHDVDYDIIGLSYYPDYHGTLSVLTTTLDSLESAYPDKKIMIVETGYGAQWAMNGDYSSTVSKTWPVTEAGQKQFTDDLITELNKHSSVTGLYWWLPEDNEFWADKNPARTSWWNGSLYTQKTGKPLDAMFELQRFIGLDPTGVTVVSNDVRTKTDDKWYNLQGQRVSRHDVKGIYINNGRKVIVK